jgi:gliding-associated putative ABC transporter substrate-binding component GldG
MVNGMGIDRDSLFNKAGKAYGFPLELNLDDYFFHKGLRIEKTLIQDLYCAPIVLASGSENNTQYVPYPWVYYPLTEPEFNPIGKDIGPVFTRFASAIDTLPNALYKTLLLQSSDFTKTPSVPTIIELEQATKKINPADFNEASKAIGYLVRGEKSSLFNNRIKPFETENLEIGQLELVVFGDGNIAENQIDKGAPLALGYDKWTNNYYANKGLIMNTVHYLTGNRERLALREKSWKVALLDTQKIQQKGNFWKAIMLLGPLFLGILLGWTNQAFRSKHLSN